MHNRYFFAAFLIILLIAVPVSGSLTKIAGNAPVFVGEQNLDISSGLQGCHVIGWWENGTSMTKSPSRNITVIRSVEESGIAFRYTLEPSLYAGYPGTWYCVDKQPPRPVFTVEKPQIGIRFWDLDTDQDISGKMVPQNTNITYHVTTNLYQALQFRYRPDITPLDSFFTITLTDPSGRQLQSLYTGSYGKKDTLIIPFDTRPYITTSPYIWDKGGSWNLQSRNAQGDYVYPPGTYTITVRQNLNGMDALYSGANREGVTEASAMVTVTPVVTTSSPATPEVTPSMPPGTPIPVTTATLPQPPAPSATQPAKIPVKTTYSPLPFWIVPAGLALAAGLIARRRA